MRVDATAYGSSSRAQSIKTTGATGTTSAFPILTGYRTGKQPKKSRRCSWATSGQRSRYSHRANSGSTFTHSACTSGAVSQRTSSRRWQSLGASSHEANPRPCPSPIDPWRRAQRGRGTLAHLRAVPCRRATQQPQGVNRRSEEHTSELQSHSDLVCRLLLEKKKKLHFRP